jgi:hypothetical protein
MGQSNIASKRDRGLYSRNTGFVGLAAEGILCASLE